jgi:hypothetical protein
MTDLVLYTRQGPVKCADCADVGEKMRSAGLDFAERNAANMGLDATVDKAIGEALHAYWWRNDRMPDATPVLISRALREVWDADDLLDMQFGEGPP